MRCVVLVFVVAACSRKEVDRNLTPQQLASAKDPLAAVKDPLAVLRDTSKAWTFEVVHGTSAETLAPVADAPRAECSVKEWHADDGVARSQIDCNALTPTRARFGGALDQRLFLAYDDRGVRELPGVNQWVSKGYALGFSFPRSLDKAWTYDETEDDVHAHVETHGETANVLGKQQPVWVSISTYHPKSVREEPSHGTAMFAPGVGPYLICPQRDSATDELWCLRLAGGAPPPAPKQPDLIAKVPSAQERAGLVKFLTTMDHEMDLYGPILAGRLVVRDDLARGENREMHQVIEVTPDAIRYNDTTLDVAGLRAKLTESHEKIAADIKAGRFPRRQDPTPFLERVDLAIDGDTPWQRVRGVVDAIVAAGYVQPGFVFARTPATSAPPKTWVEDAVARVTHDHATFLADLTKRVLASCAPLRAGFATDVTIEKPVDRQIIDQLAVLIPTVDCAYDLPVLRSTLWVTLGNPNPHEVISTRIDAKKGQAIDAPASATWREVSATLRRDMKPLRFVVR